MTNFGRISAFFIACALSFQSLGAILYTNANETELNTSSSNPVDSATINRLNDACVRQEPQSYTHSETQHVRRVTAPVRAGSYAQVQILQKGCDYRPANDDLKQKPRVGMQIKRSVVDSNSVISEKRERWISFSIYFPTDYVFETSATPVENFFQVYKNDSRNFKANNFAVTLVRNDLELNSNNASANGETGITYTLENITTGVWYDITLHYILQQPGGSGGMFAWYINYPGYATPETPVSTNADAGTTVNTEAGAELHGYELNFYKYPGYCTSTYQLNAAACPYSVATGYPAATSTSTVWTGQRKVYFDEFRVGDSTSSLAEIAPHVYAGEDPADPVDTGVAIIGMNVGQPIEPNDDPIYFTASGGSVVGCLQVDITDQTGTKVTMPKCNTDANGGRFTADALSTLIGGPITVDVLYDAPIFDTSTTTSGMATWTPTNGVTVAAHTNGSTLLNYGYDTGVKLTNTGTAGIIYPATGDRVTIANAAAGAGRFVYSLDTDDEIKLQIENGVGKIEYSGVPGSLALTVSTTGTGHAITEWDNNGFHYADITFTANNSVSPASYRPQAGAKTAAYGNSVLIWDMKLWEDRIPATVSYATTLLKPDTIAPELTDCQLSAVTTTTFNLGCFRSDDTGTFYGVITSSATAPSFEQLVAGQDHTGAAALWSGLQSATSGTFTTGALDPYVQKCAYFAQTDAAANDSVVVAGEACIPAEPTVTKKFVWSTAVGNAISCYNAVNNTFAPYTGNMAVTITSGDFFTPGDNETELAYAPVVAFVAGQAEMDEADVTTGSINALSAGAQGYNYWATNGTCRADNAIQLTVE